MSNKNIQSSRFHLYDIIRLSLLFADYCWTSKTITSCDRISWFREILFFFFSFLLGGYFLLKADLSIAISFVLT